MQGKIVLQRGGRREQSRSATVVSRLAYTPAKYTGKASGRFSRALLQLLKIVDRGRGKKLLGPSRAVGHPIQPRCQSSISELDYRSAKCQRCRCRLAPKIPGATVKRGPAVQGTGVI